MNRKVLKWALLALVLSGIALAVAYRGRLDMQALTAWVDSLGAAGPLVFMLIYALATVLFLPGSVMTLAGGALFGPVWGTLYNLTGATLGASLAFLVARYVAADWAGQKSGGRLARLKRGVEDEGWRFVALTRLVPLFPFNVLNYALGLTRIRFTHYVIATYVCMLPGALAYTYLGYAGREAVAGGEGLAQKGLAALALLAIVAFLPRLVGRLRQGRWLKVDELHTQLQGAETPLVLDVRSALEFVGEQGHIEGARNVPIEELAARLAELDAWKSRAVALVCRTDKRSAKAAVLLAEHGFHRAHVVRGGMTAWNDKGLPVVH